MLTRNHNGEVSVAWRLVRVALVMTCVVAAVVAAVSTGVISLPGGDGGKSTPASDRSVLAAQPADKRWASATCTSILHWKNEIHRDETSINLGLGPAARIRDAIAATDQMISQLDRLGLPPGAGAARARADLTRLRSDIESRLRDIEHTASSVAGGNLAAIGKLVSDLENDQVLGPQITGELSHVVSVDLGLSIIETRACRELVGSPI